MILPNHSSDEEPERDEAQTQEEYLAFQVRLSRVTFSDRLDGSNVPRFPIRGLPSTGDVPSVFSG